MCCNPKCIHQITQNSSLKPSKRFIYDIPVYIFDAFQKAKKMVVWKSYVAESRMVFKTVQKNISWSSEGIHWVFQNAYAWLPIILTGGFMEWINDVTQKAYFGAHRRHAWNLLEDITVSISKTFLRLLRHIYNIAQKHYVE